MDGREANPYDAKWYKQKGKKIRFLLSDLVFYY